MKVGKKVKIISSVAIVVATAIAIACANLDNSTQNQVAGVNVTSQSTAKWKEKAPELFNNVGYSKLIESNSLINQESIVKLQGTITNPLGIRDDILDFIIKTVPENNGLTMRAAIKIAQNEQNIYYGNLTQQEALKIEHNSSLLTTCLRIYMGDYKIIKGVDALMRNTKERNAYMWKIDRKFFSWQTLGSGLTSADEDKACEKGEF